MGRSWMIQQLVSRGLQLSTNEKKSAVFVDSGTVSRIVERSFVAGVFCVSDVFLCLNR